MAKTGMRAVRSVAIWLTSLGLFTWACGDSAKDVRGGLGSVCSKDGDCQAALSCAFGSCHETCDEASDCDSGLLCVNGPSSAVCQLPSEAVCSDSQPCPIGQKCSTGGQCRDSCDDTNTCGKGLVCSSFKLCERPTENPGSGGAGGNTGLGGEAGNGVTGGVAGSGGTGSTNASGGAGTTDQGGVGGEAGTTQVSGGSSGTGFGGEAGSGGNGPIVDGEVCDSTDPGNEPEVAHKAPVGVRVQSCLHADDDADYFVFTAPENPVEGGVFVLSATDVSPAAALRMTLESTDNAPNPVLGAWDGKTGESVFAWVAVEPGSSFRVGVSAVSWAGPAEFVFRAKFLGVRDEFAPNSATDQAALIEVGDSVQGYAFAGYKSATPPTNEDFDDYFAISLEAGKLKARLSPPADARGQIELLDSSGVLVPNTVAFHGTPGAPIELNKSGIVKGNYFLRVMIFGEPPDSVGGGASPAAHVTDPYTFTVTQP